MTGSRCPREDETIRAAWAVGGLEDDPALAAHVGGCPSCAEVASLAAQFREERVRAVGSAQVPSAGLVWWRAQRRAREEAARKAARPIAVVHGIALGSGAAAAVATLAFGAGTVGGTLSAPWRFLSGLELPALPSPSILGTLPLGLAIGLGALLLLAPVVIYVALSEK
jgi:hypothetical protein